MSRRLAAISELELTGDEGAESTSAAAVAAAAEAAADSPVMDSRLAADFSARDAADAASADLSHTASTGSYLLVRFS